MSPRNWTSGIASAAALFILSAVLMLSFKPPAEADELARAYLFAIQEELIGRGFLNGSANGVEDERTKTAILDYQKRAGLPEDGRPTPGLLDHIKFALPRIEPAPRQEPAPQQDPAPPQRIETVVSSGPADPGAGEFRDAPPKADAGGASVADPGMVMLEQVGIASRNANSELESLYLRREKLAKVSAQEFQKSDDTSWNYSDATDPVTGFPEYSISSRQKSASGGEAKVTGVCRGSEVIFSVTLLTNLGQPLEATSNAAGLASVRFGFNSSYQEVLLKSDTFKNNFTIFSVGSGPEYQYDFNAEDGNWASRSPPVFNRAWFGGASVDFKSYLGVVSVRISSLNPEVARLFNRCFSR